MSLDFTLRNGRETVKGLTNYGNCSNVQLSGLALEAISLVAQRGDGCLLPHTSAVNLTSAQAFERDRRLPLV